MWWTTVSAHPPQLTPAEGSSVHLTCKLCNSIEAGCRDGHKVRLCIALAVPCTVMAWTSSRNSFHLLLQTAANCRIIESLRLEKTSQIIKSNSQPNTTVPTKSCCEVPHLMFFEHLQGR